MLREDVVQAARDGRFHVWAVSHINEGLELLTGRPAGVPNADGDYPEGTVHNAVSYTHLDVYKRQEVSSAAVRAKRVTSDMSSSPLYAS